jgi:hypothetical protein
MLSENILKSIKIQRKMSESKFLELKNEQNNAEIKILLILKIMIKTKSKILKFSKL